MKSRFRLHTLFPSLLAVFLTGYLGFVLKVAWTEQETSALIIYTFLLCFMVLVWVVIVFGELRTKALVVHLENNFVTVRGYLGLGPSRRYGFKDFDGYATSILSSKYEDFEFLYLMKNNKKLVKISAFYHRNYPELKTFLMEQLPYLGDIPYSASDEFKEVFSINRAT